MKGLLVRVSIDKGKKNGRWNAPCRADRSFCYVPIPEEEVFRPGFETTYANVGPKDDDEFINCCNGFAQGVNFVFPERLHNAQCHLDPDFRFLSYGDTGRKATRIRNFFGDSQDNFIAFYAGLRQIDNNIQTLVYAIIGFYRFRNVQLAEDIPQGNWNWNAHTRLVDRENDIVIFADHDRSGRLRKLIPIGEQHDNHQYYVQEQLLHKWGGISTRNGWIQRSVCLPKFCNPDLFLEWFEKQNPEFIHKNNIER